MSLPSELRYSQNFLHSPALVTKLVSLAQLAPGGTVLEVGPGKGIITKALAEAVGETGRAVAVELDGRLAETVRAQLRSLKQVEIVAGDILTFDLAALPAGYAAFANVPFNITSALLEKLLNPASGPAQAHLILQTDALVATDDYGTAAETLKSLMIHPLYEIEIVHHFNRLDFSPQPAVETALFAFMKRAAPLVTPGEYVLYKDFLAVVSKDRAGEGGWRRLFSKAQLAQLDTPDGLVMGRGLKAQTADGILAAFQVFTRTPAKHREVSGAWAALREEQERREQVNREGGHRRNTRPPRR
ncbi:MAG: rRNA adenine N(6)-methyltransferase family protein [Anaerolineae bacterium]|jgi:23S rRNA (adenine-N6)-dimethyltransferase|nr:rRNA adenine N(6)-methyltransferase family protein [Anaerolineae bacterium]